MKNRTLALLILLHVAVLPKLFSQNVSINSTGNMPDTSAMLDVSSTTKGFLMPRMTTAERNAIILPATGLTVFNTTIVAYQVNTGTSATPVWSTLGTGSGSVSSVSVTSANGVSGTVATPTTTPAISLTLGAITPSSVAASGSITGSNLSNTNTGDETLTSIKTKLGITTLSGSNTGDETLTSIKTKLGITTLSGSNTGDQTITLTGDVTGSGTGSFATTITPNAVTYGKMQAVSATSKLLGSSSTTTPVQEITLGTGLSITGNTLNATATAGGTVTSTSVVTGNGFAGTVATNTTTPAITLTTTVNGIVKGNGTSLSAATAGTDYAPGTSANSTGIVKTTTGTGALTTAIAADFPTLNQNTTGNAATATTATTVSNSAITNIKLADMPAMTIKGNNTAGTTAPADLSVTQVTSMLNTFTPTLKGLVPLSGGGTSNFLRADGTWQPVSTDAWGLSGNAGTSAATNFLGTTDAQDLVFKTNSTERMRIVNSVSAATGTAGDITVGNANAGTLRSNKEFVIREDGDVYGPSVLRLRNRNGENGAIFETIGSSAYLVDFLFKTGSSSAPIVSNLRFETRNSSLHVAGNTTEWQIGQPANPSLVISAAATGNSGLLIGNFGIGNANPSQKLDVTGNVKFSGALMPNNLSGNAGDILTSGGSGTAPLWTTFDTTNIASFSDKVRSLISATAPITYSNGVIGITQSSTSSDGYLSSTDWNIFNNKAGTDNSWSTTGNSVASVQKIGTITNFDFPFITNNTEKMRLSAGGNLGIGNTVTDGANAERLLVDAGTNSYNVISGKGNLNSYLQLNIKNSNAGTAASSDVVATNDAGTEANGLNFVDMGVNSSGNTSNNILGGANTGYLYSTGSNFSIGNATAGKSLLLFTGGTAITNERMRIDSSGNVGMGNTVPSEKLDITGNVKFSGALMPNNIAGTAGTFLTSNGAGAAPSWTAFDTTSIPLFSQKVRSLFSATAPVTYSNGLIGITQSSAATNGYLSSTDWNTFNNKANATSGWSITGNTGTNSGVNFLGTSDNTSLKFRTNNVQQMKIDSTGNVAIGQDVFDATNPEKLVVNAGITTSVNAFLAKGSINSYFQMNIKNLSNGAGATTDIVATADNGTESTNYVDLGINGSNYTGSAIQTGVANDGYLISAGNDFYMVNSTANKSMLFLTGGSGVANERMRILANGRIGMGVQNPTAPLVVKDTMEIRRTGSLSQLLFTNTAVTGDFRIGGDGGDLFWQGGGGRGLQMGSYWTTILTGDRQTSVYPAFVSSPNGTGVLVLGQREVSVPLGIQAFSGSQSANLTEWRNSSGTALSAVSKNGYLGIGNSAPSEKLDVTGNIKFSGALMPNNLAGVAGAILTSNGAGAAPTWSTATSGTNSGDVSIGTANGLSLTGQALSLGLASTSTTGALSSTDWNTFNNKASTANSWSTTGNNVASAQVIGTTTNFDFPFITNNTEKMRLSAGGNLGIGATVTDGTNAEKLLVDAGSTSYNVISGKGNLNSYLQLNIKNINAGTTASSDVVATNDAGTEANGINFVDMGVNSSGNTSTGVLGGANTGYLYSTGSDFSIGNATTNKSLILFTGGTTSSNERMRIEGTGNVGIGTATPAQKLDVAGSINASTSVISQGSVWVDRGNINAGTSTPGLIFGPSNSGESIASQRTSGTNSGGIDFYTGYNNRIAILNGGNVGIGTTSPSTKLHIYGTNPLTLTGVQTGTNTVNDSLLTITSGLVRKLPLSTFLTSANTWSTTGNSGTASSTNFIGTTDYKSFKIKTNNIQGLIVDSLGSVGIGTSPRFTAGATREKFLIDAGSTTSNTLLGATGDNNSFLQLNIQNTNNGNAASSDVITSANNGTDNSSYVDMGINSQGYSTGSSSLLNGSNTAYVYATGADFYVGNGAQNRDLILFTNTGTTGADGTEKMRILSGGNVGIGTTAPSQKLDVNGNINAQGSVYVDGAATDNNGTPTPGLVLGGSGSGEAISSKRTATGNQYGIDFYTQSSLRMTIYQGSGNVGIGTGTTAPGSKLTVAGDVSPNVDAVSNLGTSTKRWYTAWLSSGVINTSDRRLKTNIKNLNYGLKEVLALQPVSYNWKKTPDTDKQLGLIAQDVRKLVPESVVGDETKEMLGMKYTELIPVLINAIKEQQQQIEVLKKDIQILKDKK